MAPGTLARLERAVEGFSAQLQCAICLCAYEKPVSLPCNHCFCEECIHRALELKPLCPICKTPAKKRRLRFDSTVQALLRATEMLTAAPGAASLDAAPVVAPVKEAAVVKTAKAAEPVKEAEIQVKTEPKQVKAATKIVKTVAKAAVAAATPERRSSPRRRTQHSSQKSPTTPTLMDVWVRGGNAQQLRNSFKIKTEKVATPVTRSSPRRALAGELSSQASPMSPALFEIAVPRPKKTQAEAVMVGSSLGGEGVDTVDLTAEDENKRTEWPLPRDGVDTSVTDADTAMETQLEVGDHKQQTPSPRRRRRQYSGSVEVDVVVAETQPEVLEEEVLSPRRRQSSTDAIAQVEHAADTQQKVLELKQQRLTLRGRRRSAADALTGGTTRTSTEAPTRRRKSATDAKTHMDPTESQEQQPEALRSRLRSASNGVATDAATDQTQLEAVEPVQQTPPPRKRRRSATNGVAVVGNGAVEPPQQSLANGKAAAANGSAQTSSLAVDSQTGPPFQVEEFQVGDLVEVIERQWVGINKRGGTARITKVHGDGFYAVKFLIGGGSDHRVPGTFIRWPAEELVSDSTPSRSVRKRQRRRLSDSMVSPDLLAGKTRSSPHSAQNTRVSTKNKPKTEKKYTGMVFLCSGFKEGRMQQIDEWADLLGAEVVHHWTNHVTHLIVKCVGEDEAEEGDLSPQDSDSASPPQERSSGKRTLFGSQKPDRWVKIRSLKYLKALVGGRWIVSDEWLQGRTVDSAVLVGTNVLTFCAAV